MDDCKDGSARRRARDEGEQRECQGEPDEREREGDCLRWVEDQSAQVSRHCGARQTSHFQLPSEHGRERKQHERAEDERKDMRVGR